MSNGLEGERIKEQNETAQSQPISSILTLIQDCANRPAIGSTCMYMVLLLTNLFICQDSQEILSAHESDVQRDYIFRVTTIDCLCFESRDKMPRRYRTSQVLIIPVLSTPRNIFDLQY